MRRFLVLCSLALLGLPGAPVTAKDRTAEKAWQTLRARFLKAMKEDNLGDRLAVVKAVAKEGTLYAAKLLVAEVFVKEQNGRILEAAVNGLARDADDSAVGWLAGSASSGKWRERALILETLASRADPAPAWHAFVNGASDKDPRIRSMALFGLGSVKRPEALKLLLDALEADAWQVRVAAIEGLRSQGDESAVKPLILRLREETGRLRGDIGDALEELTGQKHGTDVDLWLSWLAAKEAGEKDPAAKPAEPPKESGPTSSTTEGPTYYGIKLLSENLVFIIDLSMSMMDPIEIDRERLMRESRARTPTGEDEEEKPRGRKRFEDAIDWWKIQNRLELAKAQLTFALGQLERKQSFDIVSFSEEAEAWQGRLVKATPLVCAKAANFVGGMKVVGGTNTWASLKTAFELAGKGRGRMRRYESGADTIFMISDGQPSVGEFITSEDILAEVRNLNRTRKIRIHVVCIENASVPFLRKLAEQNNGVYKFFKVGK